MISPEFCWQFFSPLRTERTFFVISHFHAKWIPSKLLLDTAYESFISEYLMMTKLPSGWLFQIFDCTLDSVTFLRETSTPMITGVFYLSINATAKFELRMHENLSVCRSLTFPWVSGVTFSKKFNQHFLTILSPTKKGRHDVVGQRKLILNLDVLRSAERYLWSILIFLLEVSGISIILCPDCMLKLPGKWLVSVACQSLELCTVRGISTHPPPLPLVNSLHIQ